MPFIGGWPRVRHAPSQGCGVQASNQQSSRQRRRTTTTRVAKTSEHGAARCTAATVLSATGHKALRGTKSALACSLFCTVRDRTTLCERRVKDRQTDGQTHGRTDGHTFIHKFIHSYKQRGTSAVPQCEAIADQTDTQKVRVTRHCQTLAEDGIVVARAGSIAWKHAGGCVRASAGTTAKE